MIELWLQVTIVVFLLLLLALAVVLKKIPTGTSEKTILNPLKSFELINAIEAKSQIQYHLNWARHSGDSDRVDQLEFELASMDLRIAQLK